MSRTWQRVTVVGLLMLAAVGGSFALNATSFKISAAASELRSTAEGSPERMAAGQKLAAFGPAAHDAILDLYRHDAAEVCTAVPLEGLPMDRLVEAFPTFSEGGQQAAMMFAQPKLKAGDLAMKPLVKASLTAKAASTRTLGVMLAAHPKLQLATDVVPLLKDTDSTVRVAALTVLAPRMDLVGDEDLFPALSDSDAVVRTTAASVLMARGRNEEEVQFGRRLMHPAASERLALLNDLKVEARSRDIGPWLERLSHDHDPAVRAGAIRVAAEVNLPLAEWMTKLATSDADATVRKLAAYHQKQMTGIKQVENRE